MIVSWIRKWRKSRGFKKLAYILFIGYIHCFTLKGKIISGLSLHIDSKAFLFAISQWILIKFGLPGCDDISLNLWKAFGKIGIREEIWFFVFPKIYDCATPAPKTTDFTKKGTVKSQQNCQFLGLDSDRVPKSRTAGKSPSPFASQIRYIFVFVR